MSWRSVLSVLLLREVFYMEPFYFILNQTLQAFQTEMTLFGYTFSFYNIFWWTLITGAFVWVLFRIILG